MSDKRRRRRKVLMILLERKMKQVSLPVTTNMRVQLKIQL